MTKKRRVLVGFGVCITLGALLAGCGKKESLDYAGRQEEVKVITLTDLDGSTQVVSEDAVPDQEVLSSVKEGDFSDAFSGTYAYDLLNEAEQSWYRGINAVLLARSDECVELSEEGLAAGLTQEHVDHIFQAVLLDHPEYFYVTGYQYTKYTRADQLVRVEFTGTYDVDFDTAVNKKAQIEAAAATVLAMAPQNGSDYDKVKFVYDYLIRNTEYDLNAPDNQNVYSVLCGGRSVCQGYAKTMQLLLNRMGVECTLVLGTVVGGEGHAWNLVKIDGEYYYVDATWGDASYYSSTGEQIPTDFPDVCYDYLCVTTNEIGKTHILSDKVSMPQCTATAANYYVKNGSYFTTYDKVQLQRLVDDALLTGKSDVTVKCNSAETYYLISTKLIDEQEIFSYLDGSYHSLGFAQNDQQWTLTFWMTK